MYLMEHKTDASQSHIWINQVQTLPLVLQPLVPHSPGSERVLKFNEILALISYEEQLGDGMVA